MPQTGDVYLLRLGRVYTFPDQTLYKYIRLNNTEQMTIHIRHIQREGTYIKKGGYCDMIDAVNDDNVWVLGMNKKKQYG